MSYLVVQGKYISVPGYIIYFLFIYNILAENQANPNSANALGDTSSHSKVVLDNM